MIKAGATRIGASASVKIVQSSLYLNNGEFAANNTTDKNLLIRMANEALRKAFKAGESLHSAQTCF